MKWCDYFSDISIACLSTAACQAIPGVFLKKHCIQTGGRITLVAGMEKLIEHFCADPYFKNGPVSACNDGRLDGFIETVLSILVIEISWNSV
jgi:hypothetical protein